MKMRVKRKTKGNQRGGRPFSAVINGGLFVYNSKPVIKVRAFVLEALYKLHIRARYPHDLAYKNIKIYKKYSDSPASKSIHKASVTAFIISFVIFSGLQNLLPNVFNLGHPNTAYAGANSKTWTTNGDFSYNKSSLCGATTVSTNAQITGSAYSDGTCAAVDTDSSVTLKSSTTIAQEPSASANPANSVYTDGTYAYFVGSTSTQTQLRVEKRNATDLSLVNGFGTGGVKTIDQSTLNDDYYDVTGDSNYLYAGGLSYANYASSWNPKYFISKISKTDGTTTVLYKDNSQTGIVKGITTDGAGNLYAIGIGGSDVKLFKLNTSGVFDSAFGGGIITIAGVINSNKMARIYYESGYVYIQYDTNLGGNTRRLEKRSATDGSLVGTFGTNGIVTDGVASGGVVNSSGMVTDANYLYTTWGNWIEKRDKNTGAYVSAFGTSGKVDGTASAITYSDLVIDGSYLIVAGQKNTAGNLNWRFEKRNITDGALDTTFGTNGYIDRDYNASTNDYINKIVRSGGNIYASGVGINIWQTAHIATAYQSPGSITGFKVNGGVGTKSKWTNVSWVLGTALPANTTLSFKTRGTNVASPTGGTPIDQANPDDGWTALADLTGVSNSDTTHYSGTVATTATTWLEIQLTLTSSNGVSAPTLDSFRIDYNSLDAPATLTAYKTDGTQIAADAYINKTEAKLKADVGVPFSPSSSSSPITTELEVRNTDSGWTGTPGTYPTGVTANPGSITYSCSADPCSALGSQEVGTLYNLAAGTYYYRVRTKDGAGRVSAWSATSSAFKVEATAPTISSFSITGANITGSFAKGRDVTLNISAGDTGGSGLTEMRFANEDNVWSNWESITPPTTKAWTLSTGDGAKKVYAQVRDAAGNISSSWTQTLQADFDATGSINNQTSTSSPTGTLTLLKSSIPEGSIDNGDGTFTSRYYPSDDGYIWTQAGYYEGSTSWTHSEIGLISDPEVGDTQYRAFEKYSISGITGNISSASLNLYLDSKNILDSTVAVVDSIPDYGTLQGNDWGTAAYSSNIGTIFNGSSANGQYSTVDVTSAVLADKSASRSFSTFRIRPSADSSTSYWHPQSRNNTNKPYLSVVWRPQYQASGDYTSAVKDNTATRDYGHIAWNADVPAQTGANALRFQIAANNDNATWNYTGPNGAAGTYYNNGDQLWSGLNGNRYIRYKAYFQTANTSYTATVYDVNIEVLSSVSSIALDTVGPAAFSLTTPTNNTWQGSAVPTLNWAAPSPNDVDHYELYVDGTDGGHLSRGSISGSATNTTPGSALSEGMHSWTIKAYDLAGNSTQSANTLNIGYDNTPPVAPQSFTVTGLTDSIALAWSFANNINAPLSTIRVERIDWTAYNPAVPAWSTDPTTSPSYKYIDYAGDTLTAVYSVSDIDPMTKITQGKKYAYRISAKDSVNAAFGTLSTVKSGLTQDSSFDAVINDVVVAPCDGVNNCSTNSNVRHKGFENKISWNPAVDSGVGTSHYLIYRSIQDLNAGNYSDPNVRNSYTIVGVLPFVSGQQTEWYDNDANNDGINTFYDASGNPITISSEIQDLTTKTIASSRLSDYTIYFYRVVGVDLYNNPFGGGAEPIFNESPSSNVFEVIKAHQNGNEGLEVERTPDVTAPSIPQNVRAVATGIDGEPLEEGQLEPNQGMTVSWDTSTDNSGRAAVYQLFRSDGTISGPTGNWQELTLSDNTATSYQDVGLSPNTYYYYRVLAKDPDNNISDYSDPNGPTKTRTSSVPTTPTYVTVRALKGNPTDTNVGHQMNIQFNGSAIRYSTNSITGYEVYRATTNYATEAEWLATAPVKVFDNISFAGYDAGILYDVQRSFTESVPASATTYYYRVRAIGQNSEGEAISGLSAIQTSTLYYGWDTTADTVAPQLPAGLKVKDIHDDGANFKRNIVTWERIPNPSRGGLNDFKEYRVFRSNDGLTWSQICKNDTSTILLPACTSQYPNPLYNANQEIGMATNYFMDLIPINESNQYYYYYVTSVDDAGTNFKYANGTVINPNFSNESVPPRDSEDNILAVSLNPAIAQPSINTVSSGPYAGKKAKLDFVGVSSATISWTTDQLADSIVEFRKKNSGAPYIGTINRSFGITHSVTIKPLEPNTDYDYRVVSRNYLANDVTASDSDVPSLTTSGFNITFGEAVTTTSTAEIKWTTNLDASSAFIEYQLQAQPGDDAQGGTAGVEPSALSTSPRSHSVVVKGLRSNRTYTYKIKSISTDGYIAETEFLTLRSKTFDSAQFTLTPSSSNVAEHNITSTTAQIIWQTGSPTTSWVDYSTRSGVYDNSAGDNSLNTQHAVQIEGLVPGTKYFYRVRVKDANEVEFTSQEYSFTAVLKPKISDFRFTEIKPYEITVSWTTNVDTETIVNWGKTAAYGEKRGKNEQTKNHILKIDQLEDNTEYHMQIVAHDETGTEVVDADKVIKTPLDTEGPKIENVKTDILPMGASDDTGSVVISWNTNKPATTLVEYDEGIISGRYGNRSIEDRTLNLSHTVIIKDLKPASSYHYRIVSKDKRGNTTQSNDYTFVTPSKEKSILQLILKSLEETFAWTRNMNSFFTNIGKRIRGQ